MLPRLLEQGTRSAAIPQHARDEFAQVGARLDGQDIIADESPDVGNDQWDAVDDRIFPQAVRIGAKQRPLHDMACLFPDDLGQTQFCARGSSLPAHRTHRAQCFEMLPPHAG